MIQKILRALGMSSRVLVVILTFTLDVKVKADVVVTSIKGQVDVEKNHQILTPEAVKILPVQISYEQLDLQTYDGAYVRYSINKGVSVGMGPQSFISFEGNTSFKFLKGKAYFSVTGEKASFKMSTPQGEIETPNSDFFVDLSGDQTTVSVLAGEVNLIDRAAHKTTTISAGYKSWLGGLTAKGSRAHPVRAESYPLDQIMSEAKSLMGWTDKEIEAKRDTLRPVWKEAVLKSAEESQAALDQDISALHEILDRQRRLEQKKQREQAQLRKLFRAKTIGVPDENPQFPSVIERDPSSDSE